MQCNFCQKEKTHGHRCLKLIEFYINLEAYFNLIEEKIILEWKEDKFSGAGELGEYFASEFLSLSKEYQDISLSDLSRSKISEKCRKLLRRNSVYTRSTPKRIIKIQSSMLQKYGVINPGQRKENILKLNLRNNNNVPKVNYSEELRAYNKKVMLLTRKNKKLLEIPIEDYYTGLIFPKEVIDPELMQGDFYPTIDHKLSILYCFLTGLTAEDCAAPSNLAWTFRCINSLKGHLTDSQFRQTLLLIIKPRLAFEFKIRGWGIL